MEKREQQRISARDLLLFTRYLSTLITAGLPISQALVVMGRDQENPLLQNRIEKIQAEMAKGETLGRAFSQFPLSFDEFYCNVIKAGEKSGTLDKVLKRLADYLDKTEILRRRIKKALTYPSIVLIVILGVSLTFLLFVVPQFQALFHAHNTEFPLLTRLLFQASHFLRSHFLKGALIGGLSWLVLYIAFKIFRSVRHFLNQGLLKMAVIGPLLRKSLATRCARALALGLEAGLPLQEALKFMEKGVGSVVYSQVLARVSREVDQGQSLSRSMGRISLFPTMMVEMVSIGETSDTLPDMLNKVADYYEEEVNSVIDYTGRLMEPLLTFLLGSLIATFTVAMYWPIF